jgi:chaperonin cofactor prefoldin
MAGDLQEGVEVDLEVSKEDPRDKIIKDLQDKLEAATFRVGYLQHQVETKEEQIKLLTDSQHKPSWWLRLKNLFLVEPKR